MKDSPLLLSALLRSAYPMFRPLARLFGCSFCLVAAASCSVIVNTNDREPCASSTECSARFGEPSACVNATCTKLLTTECTEVYPANALSQDNVLLVGFMGALAGGPDDYGVPTKEGAEVALHEMEAAVNGLPAPTGSTVQRHLAMLVCDDSSDPVRVARPLIEDANVPVIIGSSYSTPTLKLFKGAAHAAQVLVLSPPATSPAITDEAD